MYYVRRGFDCAAQHVSSFDKDSIKDEPICYGILRGCEEILKESQKQNINYWYIDNGYIGGDYIKTPKNISKTSYYRITKNDTQAKYIDYEYPSDRASVLKVEMKSWKDNKNGLVLILPPTDAICKYYQVDADKWLEVIKSKIGNKPYKVRTKSDRHIPFKEELDNARCVITYNSNAALEAVFYGVPTIIDSENSIVKKWNNLSIDDLDFSYEKSINLDRNKLLNFLSYHQFTLWEIFDGVAHKIIKDFDSRNLY
jgi:hypothetical protein